MNIFSIPIVYEKIDVDIKQLANETINDSWQESWVTGNFLDGTELSKFKKIVDQKVNQYFKDCGFNNMDLTATTVWANHNNLGDNIFPHHHGQSLVAWNFYVSTPENSGDLYFINPVGNSSWDYVPLEHIDDVNGRFLYRLKPKEGHIVIFPGWLQHYVDPNKTQNIRTSITGDYHSKDFVEFLNTTSIHATRDLKNPNKYPKKEVNND